MSTETIRFICSECSYRARLPSKYDGKLIKCPSCKATQRVEADHGDPTGSTVAIKRLNEKTEGQPEKFRFVCRACSYRAKIPVKYAGMAIKCPSCGEAQMAEMKADEQDDSGDTVNITKVDVTASSDQDGRFRFQCTECGYRARLPDRFKGQNIKCPGCGAAQQADPLDESVPSSGDTMVVQLVEEVPATDLSSTTLDDEPTITPPRGLPVLPPNEVADEAPAPFDPAADAEVPLAPVAAADITPSGANLQLEDEDDGEEPTIRPGSSSIIPAVAPPAEAAGQQDDGSLHFDPFAAEREAEAAGDDDTATNQALLDEIRDGGGAPPPPPPPPPPSADSKTSSRRIAVPSGSDAPPPPPAAAAAPVEIAGDQAPPADEPVDETALVDEAPAVDEPADEAAVADEAPEEAADAAAVSDDVADEDAVTTADDPVDDAAPLDPPDDSGLRKRRGVSGAIKEEAPTKEPKGRGKRSSANLPPQPAEAAPAKGGGKGGMIVLVILLIAALGGGGFCFKQWQDFQGNYNAEVEAHSTTKDTLTGEITAEKKKYTQDTTALQGTIDGLTTKVSGLEGDLKTKGDELIAKGKELEGKVLELEAQGKELEAKAQQLLALEGKHKQLEDAKNQLDAKVGEMEGQLEETQTKLKNMESLLKKGGMSMKAKLDQTQADLKKSQNAEAKLKAELEELKKKLGGVDKLIP